MSNSRYRTTATPIATGTASVATTLSGDGATKDIPIATASA